MCSHMPRRLLLVALLAALTCSFVAETASARKALVGIGDQKLHMFDDPRFSWLGIRKARLVVPWYLATSKGNPGEVAHVDRWLRTARRHGVEPLISFGHGWDGPLERYLPTRAEFGRAVTAFRRKWPWVRVFITWNEANHCSQPTCRFPRRAAAYFDALRQRCRGCTILATSLVDQANMVRWLRRFRRAARSPVRIIGLHNYIDVNRLRVTGTKQLLRAFKGRIWLTETGGLVYRRHYYGRAAFPESIPHAARVTRFVLRRATRLSRRIERVYLYHWNMDRPTPQIVWDSGLINRFGQARPAFNVLARYLGRNPRKAPKFRPVFWPPPSQPAPPAEQPPPSSEQPPPSSEQPPPSSEPPPQQQPPPEEPACSLVVLCPLSPFP